MMSSQDTPSKIDQARQGVRQALAAMENIPAGDVPRVITDGIQHELREVDERLQALRDDLSSTGKQTRSEEE